MQMVIFNRDEDASTIRRPLIWTASSRPSLGFDVARICCIAAVLLAKVEASNVRDNGILDLFPISVLIQDMPAPEIGRSGNCAAQVIHGRLGLKLTPARTLRGEKDQ